MAFDGIAVAAMTSELNKRLSKGRISKITQPEKDEIILTVKTNEENLKLLLSASPSIPVIYITEENKPSPMTAPNFCMVLRKHLQGGRIVSVYQPGLERAICLEVEHLNEMGDLCLRHLVLEIMGKHSNLILLDDDKKILDSLKHVSLSVSSVREVLPGRDYFIPQTVEKKNLLMCDEEEFVDYMKSCNKPVFQAIYTGFTGISPFVAEEICAQAEIASRNMANELSEQQLHNLWFTVNVIRQDIINEEFFPRILMENGKEKEFSVIKFSTYTQSCIKEYDSFSKLIFDYYSNRHNADCMRQKSADLIKNVNTILERDYKKLDLQNKQFSDSEDREKYRIYGELLNAYSYQIKSGEKKATVLNYYTNEEMDIPLNEDLSIADNAKRYFDKYTKLKRTNAALLNQIAETKADIEFLETIKMFLGFATSEEELSQIKEELYQKGFIKKSFSKKEKKKKPKPVHYVFMDRYDIYVGKNNLQNEELTFNLATGNDWWFHAKGVPGSHVVVRAPFENQAEEWDMPDEVFEVAAALAAKNSKNGGQDKVEVDYLRKKKVKKPAGGAEGYVIYHSNYSMTISTDVERFALTVLKS